MAEHIHKRNHLKTILKNSSMYFISSILTKASAVFLLPVVTRLLNPGQMGLLANLVSFYQFTGVFVSLYLDSTFNRFYFENNSDKKELEKFSSTFFWFVVIWGIFFTVILMIIGNIYLTDIYSIDFYPLVFLTTVIPLLLQLSNFGKQHLRNQVKSSGIVIPDTIIFFISIGLSLFLMIKYKMGVTGRFIGHFSVAFLSFVYFTGVLFKDKLVKFKFDKKVLFKSLKYSLPLLPLAMSSWVTEFSDRILITLYDNLGESGLYDVAYRVSRGMNLFTESIFQVYAPIMTSMYIHSKNEFNEKLGKFITFYSLVIFAAAFFLSILSKELLYFLTEAKYHGAYTLIPVLAFAFFINSQNKYLGSVFGLKKITYLATIGYFLQAVINLVFNIIFIPVIGKSAAAWSTFVSMLFLTLWCGFWFIKLLNVKFELGKLLKIIIIGILSFLSYILLDELLNLKMTWMFIIKALGIGLIFIGLIFLFKLVDIKAIKKIFFRETKND